MNSGRERDISSWQWRKMLNALKVTTTTTRCRAVWIDNRLGSVVGR